MVNGYKITVLAIIFIISYFLLGDFLSKVFDNVILYMYLLIFYFSIAVFSFSYVIFKRKSFAWFFPPFNRITGKPAQLIGLSGMLLSVVILIIFIFILFSNFF